MLRGVCRGIKGEVGTDLSRENFFEPIIGKKRKAAMCRFRRKYDVLQRKLGSYKNKTCLKVLDVGCHTGDMFFFLKDIASELHGLDVNANALKVARNRYDAKTTLCNLRAPLPYKENYFDVVIASEIIEHIPDTDAFLDNLYRVMKPGGYLMLTTPNINTIHNRLRIPFGLYPLHMSHRQPYPDNPKDIGHIRFFNATVLRSQLHEHGFIDVGIYGLNLIPIMWMARFHMFYKLNSIMADMCASFSPGLIAVAQKNEASPKNQLT
ncbi:MAG: class I SAM-dependent methyltransferase [Nitrospirota bacterium]|nr:class I SAM-dependent methyltransferase [Nitrospirota bacterium]